MKILGYIGFAIFSIFFSLYLTFPSDVLGQRLGYEIRKKTEGEVNLSFESFDLSGLNGVEAEGIDVKLGKEPPIRIDAISSHVQLWSLLTFNPALETEIELGNGKVELEATPQETGMALDVEIDKLDLAKPSLIAKYAGLPVRGIVKADLETGWKTGLKTLGGQGKIKLDQVSVGPGAIAGISFPAISLGDIEFELTAKKGVVELKSYKQSGGNFQTRLAGKIELRSRLASSTFRDFCIQFKGDPEFLNKNSKLKSAIELASIKLKKAPDNFMHVSFSGPMGRVRLKRGLCRNAGAKKAPR